jgi:hypothetical protein
MLCLRTCNIDVEPLKCLPVILNHCTTQFVHKYRYRIFIIFCLFALTFHGHIAMSPLIPYNIKFVQCGFTESTTFEEHILHVTQGFTVINFSVEDCIYT